MIYDYAREGGNNYPVEFGQIWRAGEHVIACGDLEHGHGLTLIERYGPAQLLITDSPWNAGNARSFRTKAEPFIGGQSRPVDFSALLRLIISCAMHTNNGAFFEMGVAETPLLEKLIAEAGGEVEGVWDVTYYRSKPCKWIRMAAPINPYLAEDYREKLRAEQVIPTRAEIQALYAPIFEGKDDTEVVAPAIALYTEKSDVSQVASLVFDPCTGRGLMAETAHRLNRRFLGLELHPKRLSVTLTKLAGYGLTPRHDGNL